jgi:hypothetical protein
MQRTAEFDALVEESQAYLQGRQALLDAEYHIFQWPRYDWSQESAQLIFSDAGRQRVIADIQFVGSISTKSDTWLWAWANNSVAPKLYKKMSQVRGYGASRRILQLTTEKWHGHEVDGWEMTSIAAHLLQAAGAYRSAGDFGFTFMVMTDVRWAS